MLAAGPPDARIQGIDARDLGAFVARSEWRPGSRTRTASSVRPSRRRWPTMVDASAARAGADTSVVWADPELVRALGDEHERWFPMWHPHLPGFHAYDAAKATAAGLRPRPFDETIADTLAWDRERGSRRSRRGCRRRRSGSSWTPGGASRELRPSLQVARHAFAPIAALRSARRRRRPGVRSRGATSPDRTGGWFETRRGPWPPGQASSSSAPAVAVQCPGSSHRTRISPWYRSEVSVMPTRPRTPPWSISTARSRRGPPRGSPTGPDRTPFPPGLRVRTSGCGSDGRPLQRREDERGRGTVDDDRPGEAAATTTGSRSGPGRVGSDGPGSNT